MFIKKIIIFLLLKKFISMYTYIIIIIISKKFLKKIDLIEDKVKKLNIYIEIGWNRTISGISNRFTVYRLYQSATISFNY